MKDIAAPDANVLPALGAAWFLFAVSVKVILMSFLTSEAGLLYRIDVIDGRKSEVARDGPNGHGPSGSQHSTQRSFRPARDGDGAP